MALWDKLKRGVEIAADEAEKQATIARYSLELNGVRGQIRNKVESLGQVALDLYRKGAIDHPDMEALVVEISDLEARVAEIEKQIAEVREGGSGDDDAQASNGAVTPEVPKAEESSDGEVSAPVASSPESSDEETRPSDS